MTTMTPAPPQTPAPRKHHRIRNALLIAGSLITALIILAAALAASGTNTAVKSTPAPPASTSAPAAPAQAPAAPSTYNLATGTTITETDSTTGASWDVTVNSIHGYTQGQYEPAPPAGTHYIIVSITYAATTGQANVSELNWAAKDTTGTVHTAQIVLEPGELQATTITAPSKVQGTVVMAVPDGSAGTIVYTAGLQERASWAYTAAQAAG